MTYAITKEQLESLVELHNKPDFDGDYDLDDWWKTTYNKFIRSDIYDAWETGLNFTINEFRKNFESETIIRLRRRGIEYAVGPIRKNVLDAYNQTYNDKASQSSPSVINIINIYKEEKTTEEKIPPQDKISPLQTENTKELPEDIKEKIRPYVEKLVLSQDDKEYFYKSIAELYYNNRIIIERELISKNTQKDIQDAMKNIFDKLQLNRELMIRLMANLFRKQFDNSSYNSIESNFRRKNPKS